MTVQLSENSPRLVHARRFGRELDKAMRTRKVGSKPLRAATGVATSAIAMWRCGANLPRLDTAMRVAEALSWPKLADIARAGRTDVCARCSRAFVNEGGNAKRFCTPECRDIDAQLRRPAAGAELAEVVRSELAKDTPAKGWTPRAPLASALARYSASEARRVQRRDMQGAALEGFRQAVAAMCAGCEPEGACKTPECPLRDVSPLPLIERQVDLAVRPEGLWGPSHRDETLARIRDANAERWSRPGERERQSARSLAAHANRTPEERAAIAAAISAGRRGVA